MRGTATIKLVMANSDIGPLTSEISWRHSNRENLHGCLLDPEYPPPTYIACEQAPNNRAKYTGKSTDTANQAANEWKHFLRTYFDHDDNA